MSDKKTVVTAGIGAALLGIGGASALFGLHRYQALFIGLGLLMLATAAWLAVRKHNRCCVVPNRKQNARIVLTVFGIGIAFYLLLQFAVLPVLSRTASNTIQPDSVAAAESNPLATLQLEISGMSCAGYAVGIDQALLAVPGVREAHVD